MNDIESRLADAMAARAGEVEPHDEDDALNRISERVNVNRRRGLTVLGIAAALMIAVGAVALLNRDHDKKERVNVATDSSGNTTTTTADTTPASVIPSPGAEPIWPFASMNRTFASPEEAAKTFAVDYLGMTVSRMGAILNPDSEKADVEIFPNERGNARTLVHVEQHPPRGWVVVGASADMIEVDTPAPHDPLSSTLAVSGRSLAFEAQINLELRPYGSTTPVFEDFTMGGGTEVLPFSTTITPPATDQPLVLVVFEGDASGEGRMAQATVIPLDAVGGAEPTEFVAITNADELVRLDFAGHVQQTLASQVAQFAYSPTARLVAYTKLGEACRTDFVSLAGHPTPDGFVGNGLVFDAAGENLAYVTCDGAMRVRNLVRGLDEGAAPQFVGQLAPGMSGSLPTLRGRFETVAFFDSSHIASYNLSTGVTTKLVQPAAEPISLDADESGRFLLWIDVNHDVWKWSGGEPVKVGSGFNSAAW